MNTFCLLWDGFCIFDGRSSDEALALRKDSHPAGGLPDRDCAMKKKIIPILLALVILFVLLMVINPGFQEKIYGLIDYLSKWLGIDWGAIRGWRSAKLLLCNDSFALHL